jgi:hypothetical protein
MEVAKPTHACPEALPNETSSSCDDPVDAPIDREPHAAGLEPIANRGRAGHQYPRCGEMVRPNSSGGPGTAGQLLAVHPAASSAARVAPDGGAGLAAPASDRLGNQPGAGRAAIDGGAGPAAGRAGPTAGPGASSGGAPLRMTPCRAICCISTSNPWAGRRLGHRVTRDRQDRVGRQGLGVRPCRHRRCHPAGLRGSPPLTAPPRLHAERFIPTLLREWAHRWPYVSSETRAFRHDSGLQSASQSADPGPSVAGLPRSGARASDLLTLTPRLLSQSLSAWQATPATSHSYRHPIWPQRPRAFHEDPRQDEVLGRRSTTGLWRRIRAKAVIPACGAAKKPLPASILITCRCRSRPRRLPP